MLRQLYFEVISELPVGLILSTWEVKNVIVIVSVDTNVIFIGLLVSSTSLSLKYMLSL
jgi:hypothetical protein